MPILRVKISRCHTYGIGQVTRDAGRSLKRYLTRYVEAGESDGSLFTGGFFGVRQSPGRDNRYKQLDWIRLTVNRWNRELGPRVLRGCDGIRLTLKFEKRPFMDLVESKIDTEQSLLEIWTQTIELLRMRHGWNNPDGELAWISAAKPGRPILIALFPTSRSGVPLETLYQNGPQFFPELTAIVNMAAELFWREHLRYGYQTPEYKKWIGIDPMEEPPLPPIADYSEAKVARMRSSGHDKPALKLMLLPKDAVADIELALGIDNTFRKPRHEGMCRLRSMVAVSGPRDKLGIQFWKLLQYRTRIPAAAIGALKEGFRDEAICIDALANDLKKWVRPPERLVADKLESGDQDWAVALFDLVLGLEDDAGNVAVLAKGAALAEEMESRIKRLRDEYLPELWKHRGDLVRRSIGARLRARQYRNAARSVALQLGESSQVVLVLSRLACGAVRASDILDARLDEFEAGFEHKSGVFERRIARRDWAIAKGKMVGIVNDGVPWPPHFDPIAVFGVLQAGEVAQPAPDDTILARLIRAIRPRRLQRGQMLQKSLMPK